MSAIATTGTQVVCKQGCRSVSTMNCVSKMGTMTDQCALYLNVFGTDCYLIVAH